MEEYSMKQHVFDTIHDLVLAFTYYDRKEDEELPRGEIENLIEQGELTVEDIVNEFERQLKEQLNIES